MLFFHKTMLSAIGQQPVINNTLYNRNRRSLIAMAFLEIILFCRLPHLTKSSWRPKTKCDPGVTPSTYSQTLNKYQSEHKVKTEFTTKYLKLQIIPEQRICMLQCFQ
ncbi:hypothetical protein KC19_5G097300 [Ceratodon purpureus]|uniref:Uncharacterized protein n=1 Tax=Ceratodon purpureus TaxID=3225 RepID=A0A8T0HZN8_CERPU|nr:hypothetical protein KC19_5G097300 [Ceratodon purpureus]